MRNLFCEGREKGLPSWLSQFGKIKLGKLFSLPSQMNFPISFKPKVALAEFFWILQSKNCYSILGLDTMPLSLKNLLLMQFHKNFDPIEMAFIYRWQEFEFA